MTAAVAVTSFDGRRRMALLRLVGPRNPGLLRPAGSLTRGCGLIGCVSVRRVVA